MPCCLDIEDIDELPEIFNPEQIEYIRGLNHSHLVNLSGQLVDIIDACNLPKTQRRAVKALVNNALVDFDYDFKADIELVTADETDTKTPEIITHIDAVCPYCGADFKSMVIITETKKQEGIDSKSLLTDTCPHCDREMNVKSCSVRLISDLQMIKREGDN